MLDAHPLYEMTGLGSFKPDVKAGIFGLFIVVVIEEK